MFEYHYTIPASDITPVYKHVHHAQCLRYLEEARLKWLEAVGFPTELFMERGLFLVITKIEVGYRREVFEEPLVITCENVKILGKEIILDQRIIKKERNRVAVEAVVHSVCMDGKTKRAVDLPADFVTTVNEKSHLKP